MSIYSKVRRLRYREGLAISEIARRTSLSRNTIKAWLKEPLRSEMRYQRPAGIKKIDAFRGDRTPGGKRPSFEVVQNQLVT